MICVNIILGHCASKIHVEYRIKDIDGIERGLVNQKSIILAIKQTGVFIQVSFRIKQKNIRFISH